MKKCLNCKKDFPDDFNSCPLCGKKLMTLKKTAENMCKKCEKIFSKKFSYCPECGSKLKSEKTSSRNLNLNLKKHTKIFLILAAIVIFISIFLQLQKPQNIHDQISNKDKLITTTSTTQPVKSPQVDRCQPTNYRRECSGNKVFWVDKCGRLGQVYDYCDVNEFCQNGECKTTPTTTTTRPKEPTVIIVDKILLDIEKPNGRVVQAEVGINGLNPDIVDDIQIYGIIGHDENAVASGSILVLDTTAQLTWSGSGNRVKENGRVINQKITYSSGGRDFLDYIVVGGAKFYYIGSKNGKNHYNRGKILDFLSSEGYVSQYLDYKFKIDHLIYGEKKSNKKYQKPISTTTIRRTSTTTIRQSSTTTIQNECKRDSDGDGIKNCEEDTNNNERYDKSTDRSDFKRTDTDLDGAPDGIDFDEDGVVDFQDQNPKESFTKTSRYIWGYDPYDDKYENQNYELNYEYSSDTVDYYRTLLKYIGWNFEDNYALERIEDYRHRIKADFQKKAYELSNQAVQYDDMEAVRFIAAFTTSFPYNHNKVDEGYRWRLLHEGKWYQSPSETLILGTGVCADFAVLAANLLSYGWGIDTILIEVIPCSERGDHALIGVNFPGVESRMPENSEFVWHRDKKFFIVEVTPNTDDGYSATYGKYKVKDNRCNHPDKKYYIHETTWEA